MHGMGRANGLDAYNRVQAELMARYLARGGTPEQWCQSRAAAFRRRFGWMLAPEENLQAAVRGPIR